MDYIAVEGVIGVGKTSLATLLAERLGARLLQEVVEENPFLAKFYQDRSRFAFSAQVFFLLSRYRQLSEVQQPDLFTSGVVADYLFDKDWIFASLNLGGAEWKLYQGLYTELRPRLTRPSLVVYLRADTDLLLKRIAKRGRLFERAIDPGYLKELGRAYDRYFAACDLPVLRLEAGDFDFVENPLHREAVLALVLGELRRGVRPSREVTGSRDSPSGPKDPVTRAGGGTALTSVVMPRPRPVPLLGER